MMSSHVFKKRTPGPQSACMVRYLEGLANLVCVSQLEEPCVSVTLSSTYSNPNRAEEPKAVLNTLDRYFAKK